MQTELKILKLTSDVVFKAFMLSKNTNNCKARLIHLITGIEEEELKKAEYGSRELAIHHSKDKVYKTDIVVIVDKSVLSIEMNQKYYPESNIKNFRYMNQLASELYEKGETYDNRKCYQLNFDNFDQYKKKKLIYCFEMMEKEDHFVDELNYKKYHINLEKLKDTCYTDNANDELIKILRLFTVETEKGLEELRGEGYMDEAINEVRRICQDERIIGLYDKEEEERRVRECIMRYEKQQAIQEGFEKGIQKGIEKGIQKGIQKGIKQGVQQGTFKEKIEIAKKLLNQEIPQNIIMQVTNLTKEQLDNIDKN